MERFETRESCDIDLHRVWGVISGFQCAGVISDSFGRVWYLQTSSNIFKHASTMSVER